MWGFPKIRVTFLGVLLIWVIVFWGLYWGPPVLGNCHVSRVSSGPLTLRTLSSKVWSQEEALRVQGPK